jgi:hypothetical protein
MTRLMPKTARSRPWPAAAADAWARGISGERRAWRTRPKSGTRPERRSASIVAIGSASGARHAGPITAAGLSICARRSSRRSAARSPRLAYRSASGARYGHWDHRLHRFHAPGARSMHVCLESRRDLACHARSKPGRSARWSQRAPGANRGGSSRVPRQRARACPRDVARAMWPGRAWPAQGQSSASGSSAISSNLSTREATVRHTSGSNPLRANSA